MPRPKTQSEWAQIITWIIELVKEHGRITTNDVVAMFDLHRTTAEKYIRTAVQRGELLRYGWCGIFLAQRAVIDFDVKRFSHNKK